LCGSHGLTVAPSRGNWPTPPPCRGFSACTLGQGWPSGQSIFIPCCMDNNREELMTKSDSTTTRQTIPKPGVLRRRRMGRMHASYGSDETLVVDPRDRLRPAQMVEKKLLALLKYGYRPISHTLSRGLSNGRSHR